MATPLSLDGLFGLWSEARRRNEPTVAFELVNGRGRFLFMMFFDEEDPETKDKLLLFLQNSRSMLNLKLYGAHERGQFLLYLRDSQVDQIRRELELTDSLGPVFDLTRFIGALNQAMPKSLPLASKIQVLQENRSVLEPHMPDLVDEFLKTELIGPMQLDSSKRPREKTLRKLYLYGGSPLVVAKKIEELKKQNCTLRWRVPKATVSSQA